jgi:hypothetical protein
LKSKFENTFCQRLSKCPLITISYLLIMSLTLLFELEQRIFPAP